MNCQEVQQLLTFAERKAEALDPIERASLEHHLEKCQACSECARKERGNEQAIGTAMRDVLAPTGLKIKVLKQLAAERGGVPWKWAGALAASALFFAGVSGLVWHYGKQPNLHSGHAVDYVGRCHMNEDQAEEYFAGQGLPVRIPRYFDFRYLQHVKVVEFQGRRVAELTFSRTEAPSTFATVLIIAPNQFNIRDPELLKDHFIPHTTSIQIRRDVRGVETFTDLIFFRGDLQAILRQMN